MFLRLSGPCTHIIVNCTTNVIVCFLTTMKGRRPKRGLRPHQGLRGGFSSRAGIVANLPQTDHGNGKKDIEGGQTPRHLKT